MDNQPQPSALSTQPLASSSSFFRVAERDLLAELLADKRSENTRRAYSKDLRDFFLAAANHEPNPQLVAEFLKLERFTAIGLVLQYKATLIEKGLAEATVNRRLAAIKSLVRYAQKVGRCEWSLEEVEGERVQQYRDTTGVDQATYQHILKTVDRSTLAGKRNYAILLLLWTNVLRRSEVCKLNISDLSPDGRSLRVLGKGRGTQAELVSLSEKTVEAFAQWLEARGDRLGGYFPTDPLFISLANNSRGHRLTGDAIYDLVQEATVKAGIQKRMSPHRVRHSGITEALNLTNGDVRKVQKLSRHKRLDTLMIYDDNRKDLQGEITNLLSEAID